jgi:hypothetical protein
MAFKTWLGWHPGNGARNPQNWSPTGAPQPGDYLTMQSGNMNLTSEP